MIDPRSPKMGDKSSHRNSLKRYVALSSGAPAIVASPSHEAFFERFAFCRCLSDPYRSALDADAETLRARCRGSS